MKKGLSHFVILTVGLLIWDYMIMYTWELGVLSIESKRLILTLLIFVLYTTALM